MIFGIRKRFMATPEGDGVVTVPYPMVEGESPQNQVMTDQEWRGLRYKLPNLGTLENVHPNLEIKGLLWEHMEFDLMKDEVMTAWEMIVEHETDEEE